MPVYNFKTITVVPSAKDFVDIVLSKTQRKTPTVVHKGYAISRIRGFYMRKVKFTQQSFHDKLTQMLEDFPRLDDIHPFYADLINILYSKDHYKLALGQINMARQLIDNLGKDYLKLLKFADSLYRCKELKRACLGRMCTMVKKLNASLGYLEQVRQHLTRLPSIDPSTRTLLITGYPNVGKSSFINKLSRANVEVQPYAFTTKSLFVGHTDYKYMRWQIIDTPGILDHPLEERNTIEMQAITALAHLHATVLFFVDISETCGYSIPQQVSLFHTIKPLFANKPLLVVANKIDLTKWEALTEEQRTLINDMAKDRSTEIMQMSNISEEGINNVKSQACDMLLQHRVERKLKSKRVTEVVNRITVAKPVARDSKARPVSIPPSVLAARQAGMVKPPPRARTEKDIEREQGGPGIYAHQPEKLFKLKDDEWKWDMVPEILDGHNIVDFVDPEIETRLAELEAEEDRLQAEAEARGDMMDDEESEIDDEDRQLAQKIKSKRKLIQNVREVNRTQNKPILPRTARGADMDDAKAKLGDIGVDTGKMEERARSQSRGRKRRRDDSVAPDGELARSKSRVRSQSVRQDEGFRNVKQKLDAEKLNRTQQKQRNQNARKGEGDRHVPDLKPKHLFSGKRGIGSTDRR